MTRDEARKDIDVLITAWYEARIIPAAKKVVTINKGGFDNAAATACSLALKLHSQLIDSEGIDAHKEAAALAFSVGQNLNIIIHFPEARSEYSQPRYKDSCRADCALTVFLSMLDVDRDKIVQEPITHETLRALFLLICDTRFPHETLTAMLIAISTLGFMLERNYPQSDADVLSD